MMLAIAFLLTLDLAWGAIYGAPTASPTVTTANLNPYATSGNNPYVPTNTNTNGAGLTPQSAPQPLCFPERCQACRESFGLEPIVSYDCQGKCGLCQLCEGRPRHQIPQCERWCTLGQKVCTDNCQRGKEICLSCGPICGVY